MYKRVNKGLSLILVFILTVTSFQFTLGTKVQAAAEELTISLKKDHPNIVNVDESAHSIVVIEKTNFEKLDQQISTGSDSVIRVLDANDIPKKEIDELVTGDKFVLIKGNAKKEYRIQVNYFTLKNLALNPFPGNIKVSSIRNDTMPSNAFNGESTGNAGSGYQVDQSQSKPASISAGKDTFWLAVDLGEIQTIDQFSVAWGTNVGTLTTRLKDSKYRVEYTDDPAKWAALSNATVSGADGIINYSKPVGWDLAYEQDVRELPDANGNKVFMSNLEAPISARYVMVTGELASSWIEIYNFFVFQKVITDGESNQPVYPTGDLAKIVPDYDGMSLTVGRPAIVKKDTTVPKIHITAKEDIEVSGELRDPNGVNVYTIAKQTIKSGSTKVITPDIEASILGTYVFEWTIKGSKTVYEKIYFTAVDEDISQYNYSNPYPALYLKEDKLVYVPDYLGNTVMDYSNVGYQGGDVEIPNVPVKIILEPSEDDTTDDTERIQNAVNMLGRIAPDSNGFRGALLLKAGTYRVSNTIKISESGIVIKGEGDDHENIEKHSTPLSPTNWKDYTQSEEAKLNVTKVVATWVASSYDKNTAIFNFSGSAASKGGSPIDVVDQYVPAGGHTLRLATVNGLSIGDTVNIRRAVNAAWARDLKMDVITDAPGVPSANQWAVNGVVNSEHVNKDEERTIKSINQVTNEIILSEPLADALDMKYGVSTITKYDPTGRINNVGMENIQIISRFNPSTTAINSAFGVDYKSFDDELHAELAIRFGNAQNAWARRITTYHIDVAVSIATGVSMLTIQDMNCLEPVGGTGGERRYSFTNAGGTLVLNQRNYTRYTRHGFIVMGSIIGPNVFYNNKAEYQFDANEPHLRWSTGGLFDNVDGRIYLQNRWNNGTAHGWSGANYTLYNSTGPYIISQNPLAANYLFGQIGERLPFVMDAVDPGNVPNFRAYEYSNGSKVTPESLFIQQLKDRLGQEAVNNVNNSEIPAYIDESGDFASQFASLTGILVDGVPIENFNKDVLSYTVPVSLDYTKLPEITYTADSTANVAVKVDGNRAVTFTVSMHGKSDSVYTVNYGIIDKNVPITSSTGGSSVFNLIDGDPKTSWSASGTPWVRFYLGDQSAVIKSVSVGYSRDTQIRRSYYFDFEISNDGYNWTKVMADDWKRDNLGNGHIMGMEVIPGAGGDSVSDYETFIFPEGITARLLRVTMFGARSGTGTGTSNVNKYWAIDVDTAINMEPLKKLIAEAKIITNDAAVYTESSFAVLQAAIEVADSAVASITTDQELANALHALKVALDGLEKIAPGSGDNGGKEPGKDSGQNQGQNNNNQGQNNNNQGQNDNNQGKNKNNQDQNNKKSPKNNQGQNQQ